MGAGAEYQSDVPLSGATRMGNVRWHRRARPCRVRRDGKPVRMRGASVDITERKQAELGGGARANRTRWRHLSRVTTAGELSGSLAHELNRPLRRHSQTNAQACTENASLMARVDVAEFREILNDIVSEDKRAAEVIRRLRLWLQKGEVQQQSLRINQSCAGMSLKLDPYRSHQSKRQCRY